MSDRVGHPADGEAPDEKRARALFGPFRAEGAFEPPPALKTRVLANHRSALERARARRFWAFSGLAATLSAASLVTITFFFTKRHFESQVDQKLMVMIRDEASPVFSRVKHVQVELPDGVHFDSAGIPEMRDRKVLIIPWEENGVRPDLPLFIQADEPGVKIVRIRYLDQLQREVVSRSLPIRVKAAGGREL